MIQGNLTIPQGPRLRTAMAVAILADVLEMLVFPLFVEGFDSPVADLIDLCVGGILTYLLGWHWEFAPSFLAKLMPGVDLVPLWTMAVANVYRKSKQIPQPDEAPRVERHVGASEAHPRRS